MADRITSVLDHVAVAVPSWDAAETRWRDTLGGGRLSGEHESGLGPMGEHDGQPHAQVGAAAGQGLGRVEGEMRNHALQIRRSRAE